MPHQGRSKHGQKVVLAQVKVVQAHDQARCLEIGGRKPIDVVDTPGLKSFALWDIVPEELEAYYPEIARFAPQCRYPGCSHLHEPDCAVWQAVDRGEIHPDRYESYAMLYEDTAETDWWE